MTTSINTSKTDSLSQTTDFQIWTTINPGNIGGDCGGHNARSIFNQEVDLVCVQESILNCWCAGSRGLEEKVASMGLEMCPPCITTCIALAGVLPQEAKDGVWIGHKPISTFHGGTITGEHFYRVNRRKALSSVRGNPWGQYETSPLEIVLSNAEYMRGNFCKGIPPLKDPKQYWIFVKPRK